MPNESAVAPARQEDHRPAPSSTCRWRTIRIATHCTEADVSEQHITHARKFGLDTVGFLMKAHSTDGRGGMHRRKAAHAASHSSFHGVRVQVMRSSK
jgi:hypothetical protein